MKEHSKVILPEKKIKKLEKAFVFIPENNTLLVKTLSRQSIRKWRVGDNVRKALEVNNDSVSKRICLYITDEVIELWLNQYKQSASLPRLQNVVNYLHNNHIYINQENITRLLYTNLSDPTTNMKEYKYEKPVIEKNPNPIVAAKNPVVKESKPITKKNFICVGMSFEKVVRSAGWFLAFTDAGRPRVIKRFPNRSFCQYIFSDLTELLNDLDGFTTDSYIREMVIAYPDMKVDDIYKSAQIIKSNVEHLKETILEYYYDPRKESSK